MTWDFSKGAEFPGGEAGDNACLLRYNGDLGSSRLYGNFNILFGHFSRIYKLCTTPYELRDMLYVVPVLIGC